MASHAFAHFTIGQVMFAESAQTHDEVQKLAKKSVKVCLAFLLCKEYDLAYNIPNTLH